ncbi:MAG: zinc ribbon domain-containing protein [Candidatus Moduliflexus flocculans]|nr:zinc ribbon domain-containing protein [Candidatus Moduliflexus flocculans]
MNAPVPVSPRRRPRWRRGGRGGRADRQGRAKCGAQNAAGAKFCANCGEKVVVPGACPCGAQNAAGAKFCASCGKPLAGPPKCSKCGAGLPEHEVLQRVRDEGGLIVPCGVRIVRR